MLRLLTAVLSELLRVEAGVLSVFRRGYAVVGRAKRLAERRYLAAGFTTARFILNKSYISMVNFAFLEQVGVL